MELAKTAQDHSDVACIPHAGLPALEDSRYHDWLQQDPMNAELHNWAARQLHPGGARRVDLLTNALVVVAAEELGRTFEDLRLCRDDLRRLITSDVHSALHGTTEGVAELYLDLSAQLPSMETLGNLHDWLFARCSQRELDAAIKKLGTKLRVNESTLHQLFESLRNLRTTTLEKAVELNSGSNTFATLNAWSQDTTGNALIEFLTSQQIQQAAADLGLSSDSLFKARDRLLQRTLNTYAELAQEKPLLGLVAQELAHDTNPGLTDT